MFENFLPKREQRAISFQSIWGAGDTTAFETQSGTNIDQSTSLEINAFYACVSLISDTIATLPFGAFTRTDGTRVAVDPAPEWVGKPDVDMSRSEHIQQAMVSLLLDGNVFIRVFRDERARPLSMVVLDPERVQVTRSAVGRKVFTYDQGQPMNAEDIIHITDMVPPGGIRGISRVDKLKENLGLATAIQSYAARFFGQGQQSSGIIEFPGNLTADQAKDLAEGFDSRHKGYRKAHRTGILSGGAKYVPTLVPNDQAQFLESRRLSVEDIARAFLVPPHMIGLNNGSMSYASVEQNNIWFVQHTLRPYIVKLEEAYSTLLPRNQFIRINVDGLLRGDFETRQRGYNSGMQAGYYSINDIRRFEDLPPVEGGDVYRVPLANVNLSAADLVEEDKRVSMAQRLVISGFDPAMVLEALGLPAIDHTGLPSTQLQGIAQINPNDPNSEYEVE